MRDLPQGAVTFLFTDIEGSTRLWEDFPEAMRDALARHDEALRSAIESTGGAVFKTGGDAFYAVFARASDAVAAALTGQLALGSGDWSATGPLQVRMALCTGEASVRGEDYFGRPLNRCARILDAAHGGQILLSSTTAKLALGSLPQGASLSDLGEHRLRDLAETERIAMLVHPSLRSVFPPLRDLVAYPNNLPSVPRRLLGERVRSRSSKAYSNATGS